MTQHASRQAINGSEPRLHYIRLGIIGCPAELPAAAPVEPAKPKAKPTFDWTSYEAAAEAINAYAGTSYTPEFANGILNVIGIYGEAILFNHETGERIVKIKPAHMPAKSPDDVAVRMYRL